MAHKFVIKRINGRVMATMLQAPERTRYDGNLKIEWLIQNRVDAECLTFGSPLKFHKVRRLQRQRRGRDTPRLKKKKRDRPAFPVLL